MKIDTYLWYVRGKGAIATAIQTPQAFVCGDIPPATTTQIIRLTEIYSAVIAESWGALKRKFSEQSNSLN